MSIAEGSISTKQKARFAFPAINTSPIVDLQLLFLLLPLWWVLGLDQFIWVVGLFWIAMKVLVKQNLRILCVDTLKWLLLFNCIYLLSSFFIQEPERLITFSRNFSTYISASLLVLIVTNVVQDEQTLRRLIPIPVVVIALASIFGTFAILGWFRPEFTSGLGHIMPNSIKATDYGGRIAFKELGKNSWFVGLGTYFRVRSFFLYGTLYASALVAIFPILIFLIGQTRAKLIKWVLGAVVFCVGLNLIFTTARIAVISLLVGWTYFMLFAYKQQSVLRMLTITLLLVASVSILSQALFAQTFDFIINPISDRIWNFLTARGEGSFHHRLYVYELTLESWSERPLLGWGTERSIPDFPYPMGSHSQYLGTLYKQGSIGLLVYLITLFTLWKDTRLIPRYHAQAVPYLSQFLRYGRWTLIIVLLNGLTDILDLDATTMSIIWLTFALLIAAHRIAYVKLAQYESTN